MTTFLVLLGIGLLVLSYPALRAAVEVSLRYRGTRVITCPETRQPAAVEVDSRLAARTASLSRPFLRLTQCSRWPERQDCGQDCLRQIEEAPEDCLARTMLINWYEGTACVLCRKAIEPIHWADHKPALMTPRRKTLEWNEVPPEKLPATLATHLPVCWNCHIAESFRARFPDLVLDDPRPFRRAS